MRATNDDASPASDGATRPPLIPPTPGPLTSATAETAGGDVAPSPAPEPVTTTAAAPCPPDSTESGPTEPGASSAAEAAAPRSDAPQPNPPKKPVSARKRAANRANAAHSTGPRTPEGRARASLNAVTHGLTAQCAVLPGESPAELFALGAGMEADLKPRGTMERELVTRVVGILWRMRRLTRAEAALWERDDADKCRSAEISAYCTAMSGGPVLPWLQRAGQTPAEAPGGAFLAEQFSRKETSPLERMAVYEQRLDRALHAALRELNALRKLRREVGAEDDGAAGDACATATATAGAGSCAGGCVAQPTPRDVSAPSPTSVAPAGENGTGEARRASRQDEPTVDDGEDEALASAQNEPTADEGRGGREDEPAADDARAFRQNEPTGLPGGFGQPVSARTPDDGSGPA